MPLIALLIGAILIVAAIRGTQGMLFSALATDVPGYVVWAAAITALGAIGWIPGLKPISRGLLALVIIVIVLRDYQTILTGLQAAIAPNATASTSASTAPATSASTPVASATTSANLNADTVVTTPPVASTNSGNGASPFGSLIAPGDGYTFGNTAGNNGNPLGAFDLGSMDVFGGAQ